jgi:hypothetical protein
MRKITVLKYPFRNYYNYKTQIKKLTLRALKTDTKCVYLTIGLNNLLN